MWDCACPVTLLMDPAAMAVLRTRALRESVLNRPLGLTHAAIASIWRGARHLMQAHASHARVHTAQAARNAVPCTAGLATVRLAALTRACQTSSSKAAASQLRGPALHARKNTAQDARLAQMTAARRGLA
jgi:hypothetical protein